VGTLDPDGRHVGLTVDDRGLVTEAERADGRELGYSYDDRGRLAQVRLPGAGEVQIERDLRDRVIGLVEADGTKVVYHYDSASRLVQVDDQGAVTSYSYGPNQMLDTIDAPTGSLSLVWDRALRPTSLGWSDAETFAYGDPRGLMTKTTHDGLSVGTTYDADGRLASWNDAEVGQQCAQTYDAVRGLPAKLACTPGGAIGYGFDVRSLLIQYTGQGEHGNLSLSRDTLGLVGKLTVSVPGAVPARTLVAGRTLAGLLTALTLAGGGTGWSAELDAVGRPSAVIGVAAGTLDRYVQRDANDQLAAVLQVWTTPEGTRYETHGYVRDLAGDLEQRLAASCPAVADPAGWAARVVPVGTEPPSPCGAWSAVTELDIGPGHRVLAATGAEDFTDTRDETGRLVERVWDTGSLRVHWSARGYPKLFEISGDPDGPGPAQAPPGGTAVVQDFRDADAVLVARVGVGQVWRFVRQGWSERLYAGKWTGPPPSAAAPLLLSALPPVTSLGLAMQVVSVPVAGPVLWYVDPQVVAQAGGIPPSPGATPQWLWTHTDHLETPWLVEDPQSGGPVLRLERDPLGRLMLVPLTETGAATTTPTALHAALGALPLPGFPGQTHDPWTGLVHNGHRLYDPATGTYLNPDLIGQLGGLHLFQYADGDPTSKVDPDGLKGAYLTGDQMGQGFIQEVTNQARNLAKKAETAASEEAHKGGELVELGVGVIAGGAKGKGSIRQPLGKLTGKIPKGAHAHHALPQKFAEKFDNAGLKINDPKYGSWWEAEDHLEKAYEYNKAWEKFFKSHGDPDPGQILDFARELAKKYGLEIHF
jgi:RHS repeat-associated protein